MGEERNEVNQKNKKLKSEENITKSTRNLFKLEKENEIIKDLKE